MIKIKFYILFIVLLNVFFASVLDHQPKSTIIENTSLDLELFSDYSKDDIITSEIYFKTDNQIAYIKEDLFRTSDSYFNVSLSSDLISGEYVDYYFVFKLYNNEYITLPQLNPHENPFSVKILTNDIAKDNKVYNNENYIHPDYEIIAPKNNQKLFKDDIIISLSYFKIKNLSLDKIKLFIDNIDNTSFAIIRKNNLFMIPQGLGEGKHEIRVELENIDGEKYKPIIWSFYVYDKSILPSFTLNGRFWNNYINNEIDDETSYNNTSHLNFTIDSDLFKINTKLKKSSLENVLYQPYDRYYMKIDFNENFDLEYGDFYPALNDFLLNGKRIRGTGLNLNLDWFQMNILSGDFERAVQGDPFNNAMILSDYYPCTSDLEDNCSFDYVFDISRNNYTFQKEVKGISLNLGKKTSGFNWGLNLLKVKDNVNSVQSTFDSALIEIPYEMEPFSDFNSNECLDLNFDGICNESDLLVSNSVVDINNYPNSAIETYPCNEGYLEQPVLSLINYGLIVCNEDMSPHCILDQEYNHIKNVWKVNILDESNNLENFISSCSFVDEIDNSALEINLNRLDDNWGGDKPTDNVTIASDLNFKTLNDKFAFNSSIAMSLNNYNIWEPVMTLDDLDVLNDNYQDCYYERTYINPDIVIDWNECQAFDSQGNIITNQLIIDNPGLDLNDIPEDFYPENLEEYYHWNFNSVPLIPFYSLINATAEECNFGNCGNNDITTLEQCAVIKDIVDNYDDSQSCESNGGTWTNNDCIANWDWVAFDTKQDCEQSGGLWGNNLSNADIVNEILDSPSVAYDVDVSFKIKNHHFQYGLKKVGSEFNSAGNPYIQKDIIEQYFSDKIRLLDNRMYLSFKMKKIKNGILDGSDSFNTNKYDLNINYYSGINLPSLSLSLGSHSRKGGAGSMTWVEFLDSCNDDGDGVISKINANVFETNCYNDWTIYDINFDNEIEENEYPMFINTRLSTKTDNYNIGYSQNFNFNRKQSVNINYYHSTKQDLIYDVMVAENNFYVSPRSLNSSFNANLTTYYSHHFNSKFYFSNSKYNFAQQESEYYQDQKIDRVGLGFNYKYNNFLENTGAEITYSKAYGTSDYNQIGLKMHAKFVFYKNLNLNMNYRYHKKNQSSEKFYNNIFKLNLFYKF